MLSYNVYQNWLMVIRLSQLEPKNDYVGSDNFQVHLVIIPRR